MLWRIDNLSIYLSIGPFFVAYQNLPCRCLVCKHGSHVINIPKADWSSVKINN